MKFWRWGVWRWPHWGTLVLGIERAVLIGAAFLASVPLWQWYQERELQRLVNLSTAGAACESWIEDAPSIFWHIGVTAQEAAKFESQGIGNYRFNMSKICVDVREELNTDPEIEEMRRVARFLEELRVANYGGSYYGYPQ